MTSKHQKEEDGREWEYVKEKRFARRQSGGLTARCVFTSKIYHTLIIYSP
jgi:hypothetical protein